MWRQVIVSLRVDIGLHVLLDALGVEHLSQLATAIHLIDLGTGFQVHLRVFRPCLSTIAGTEDRA